MQKADIVSVNGIKDPMDKCYYQDQRTRTRYAEELIEEDIPEASRHPHSKIQGEKHLRRDQRPL